MKNIHIDSKTEVGKAQLHLLKHLKIAINEHLKELFVKPIYIKGMEFTLKTPNSEHEEWKTSFIFDFIRTDCHTSITKTKIDLSNHSFKGLRCEKCGLVVDQFVLEKVQQTPGTRINP